jgi:VWFA-related protein
MLLLKGLRAGGGELSYRDSFRQLGSTSELLSIWPGAIAAATTLIIAAALAPIAADAQQSSQEQVRRPSFDDELEVTVANLNVFVRDQGQPVEGLTASDFRIVQDGVEMDITNFAVLTPEKFAAGSTGEAGEQPKAPVSSRIQPAYVVIHFDNDNLLPIDRKRVLSRVQAFVVEALARPVRMMVVSSRSSLVIQQPFTDDADAILAALQRVAREGGSRMVRDNERHKIFRQMERFARDSMREYFPQHIESITGRLAKADARASILSYAEQESGVLDNTLASLAEVVRLVASMEGRRSIGYVSSGLPMNPGVGLIQEYVSTFHDNTILTRISERDRSKKFRVLANAANREGICLYTIDASGLNPLEGFGGEDSFFVPNAAASWASHNNLQETLSFMADETGGVAVLNTNEVADGLRTIHDDLFSYYSIGYTMAGSGSESLHSIRVELPDHPEYEVRYRKQIVERSFESLAEERLAKTLVRDIGHNPLDLQLTVGEPIPADGRRWEVPFHLSIPVLGLAMEAEAGDLVARVELLFCVRDAQGNDSQVQRRQYEVRIPAASFAPDREQRYEIRVRLRFAEQRHAVAVGLLDHGSRLSSFARTIVDLTGQSPGNQNDRT